MSAGAEVLVLVGTRPELIKLGPVVRALGEGGAGLRAWTVATGQHRDLVAPLACELGVRLDEDLAAGRAAQAPLEFHALLLEGLGPLLRERRPAAVLVQGDTGSAFAGALAAFHAGIPVGHVEAGLRTDDARNPFPEEMNRRLITRLADLHFAATARNARVLREEGVPASQIAVTGNPVVDAVLRTRAETRPSAALVDLLERVGDRRLLVLTTHRRESFGDVMAERLTGLRRFSDAHPELALVFPVHPNPEVEATADRILGGAAGVLRIPPLPYTDFIHLLDRAWLAVSDSGGVQEEAPSLGTPVLVIRENTERPEAVEAGVARLVGASPGALEHALEACVADPAWVDGVRSIPNPFGDGKAGVRITEALEGFLAKRGRA
ncbi:MAG: non-hydrolyzing UDP-N-acetylglucosamine 2-epimerase [Myxococcota bacterium]